MATLNDSGLIEYLKSTPDDPLIKTIIGIIIFIVIAMTVKWLRKNGII